MKRQYIYFAFIFSALLIAASALATTLVRAPFNEQAASADLVVVGKAVRVENTERSGFPCHRVVISVEEVVAGAAPGQIEVYQPGGRRMGAAHETLVVGVRYIRPGDEVLLFLKALPEGGYEIIGLNQGHYPVVVEPQTGRKLIQLRENPDHGAVMTLEGAKHRIHAVRANRAAGAGKAEEKKP